MSYETSNNILNYLYNPKSILGSGILIYSYNAKATDIGFISFLLNLFFDILFVLGIVKLFLSRNKSAMIMSIGLIYFPSCTKNRSNDVSIPLFVVYCIFRSFNVYKICI